MSALFQLANTCMNMMTGAPLMDPVSIKEGKWKWVSDVANSINVVLYPILILVGSAGLIYAVYLGVNLARADSADKQQEAKKRMINALIGLASIIALILLLKLFCDNVGNWLPDNMVE